MRSTVVASMRNEGPFIVEWVAWYRMLGFTDIVVTTNNCTDRSPQLLDALQRAGWVRHVPVDIPPGRSITGVKLRAAGALPEVRRADWVLVVDVDEFLVIHKGEGRLVDLVGTGDPPFLGMAINWRVFGTDGIRIWEDSPIHRQFRYASHARRPFSRWVKTLYRQPRWFRQPGEHGPKGFRLPADIRVGTSPALCMVNGAGDPVENWGPGKPYMRSVHTPQVSWQDAQINHYMLRAAECFELKRGTLSPVAGHDRYTNRYFTNANRHDELDVSANRYSQAFDAMHAQAMSLPGVAMYHHLCCANYVERLCAKQGRALKDDPRHAFHLAQARRLKQRAAAIQKRKGREGVALAPEPVSPGFPGLEE